MFDTLGYVMIFCSMFVLLFFLVKKGPLYFREAWNINKNLVENDNIFIVKSVKYVLVVLLCLGRVLINLEVIYYIASSAFSLLATLKHPFFFAFHLTEFLIRYPTLRNILKSVYESYIALSLTFILIFLFVYFVSIIAFIRFHDLYKDRCEELFMCFFESIDQHFKNNGGLGGFYEILNQKDYCKIFNKKYSFFFFFLNFFSFLVNYDYRRFLFDNICNIVITIILV